MAVTLPEAAKLESGDVVRRTVIELYAMTSDPLRVLPFEDIPGNSLKYTREGSLPGIGFRGVNEGYTESVGILNPLVESLVIAGGDVDVDLFITRTMGPSIRATNESMKIKALAHRWTLKFIKGDASADPREFDGLQRRVVGRQLIENSAGTGAALSLKNLDEAIDAVDGATHIGCNKSIKRLLTAAARDTAVGGFITHTVDEFGRQVTNYAGLPLLILDEDDQSNQILPFTEAAAGGGNTSTSIYPMSMRPGWLTGLQNGAIDVRDLGELEGKPAERLRIEWYNSIAVLHPRSVSRLRGVTNAPVVA